ncbi:hypothetical protein PRIPAC_73049, partial [Pristionchus pacificus]
YSSPSHHGSHPNTHSPNRNLRSSLHYRSFPLRTREEKCVRSVSSRARLHGRCCSEKSKENDGIRDKRLLIDFDLPQIISMGIVASDAE